MRRLRRAGEGDRGRRVGRHRHVPGAQLAAARVVGDEAAAAGELQLGLRAAGAEVGEVGPGLAQAEPRAGDAALLLVVELRQRHAAGRHGERRLLARLLGRERRPVGVAGRRHPEVEPRRRHRGRALADEGEGARQPRPVLAAGVDQPDHQEQQDRRPQRPGVAGRQGGARRAEAQAGQARHQPLAVQGPQALRERVLDARRQGVVEPAQRPVRHPAVALEAGEAARPVAEAEGLPGAPECRREAGREQSEQDGVRDRGQPVPQAQQRGREEQAGHADGRPDGGPDALRPDEQPGGEQAAPEAGGLPRIARRHRGLLRGVLVPWAQARSVSQAGTRSSANCASASRRGLTTANRSPSTRTSAARGREL